MRRRRRPYGHPATPTSFAAAPGNAQIALAWTAPSGIVTSYSLYRRTTGSEALYKSGLTSTSYTDTGLPNGRTYHYEAQAVTNAKENAVKRRAHPGRRGEY